MLSHVKAREMLRCFNRRYPQAQALCSAGLFSYAVFSKIRVYIKEDVIKVQHNCSTTRYWGAREKDFLLIMHEHLFIFRKIGAGENKAIFRDSIISNE